MISGLIVALGASTPSIASQSVPLHAGPSPTPVPHWVVLFVAVFGLWALIAGGVVVLDRLFDRWSWTA